MANDPRQDKKTASKKPVAVALRHDFERTDVPKIVAKGEGRLADQIIELAFAHGVKVREDADLAAMLVAMEIESEIPLAAFAAVSEILSYVYRANGKLAQLQAHLAREGVPPGESAP